MLTVEITARDRIVRRLRTPAGRAEFRRLLVEAEFDYLAAYRALLRLRAPELEERSFPAVIEAVRTAAKAQAAGVRSRASAWA